MNSRWPYTETSPCPPGQTRDVTQLDCLRVVDVVEVDAVVVADEQMVAAESEIGVSGAELDHAGLRRFCFRFLIGFVPLASGGPVPAAALADFGSGGGSGSGV